MPTLEAGLSAEHMAILAVDVSTETKAREQLTLARDAGAWVVKMGLELSSAIGQEGCSELAGEYDLDWVSDAKLHDIPNTTAGAVNNIVSLEHPPVGITIHTKSGTKSLAAAQKIASEAGVTMLGVTHLTSIDDEETLRYEKVLPRVVVWRESRRAVAGGIAGLVCSAQEVGMINRYKKTNGLFSMIPGTRSLGAQLGDQKRSTTPSEAVLAGANLLVIGRQVTGSIDPAQAYADVIDEIRQAKLLRNQVTARKAA